MKCAVITPIGPGHEFLYEDALDSAKEAFAAGRGPFADLVLLPVDDTKGALGRSAARNSGVQQAAAVNADWLFFLDADDVMVPGAFACVAPYTGQYDAIWGQISCMDIYGEQGELRAGQLASITGIADLLTHDPVLLLQMGHFVRTAVAAAIPFDTSLDTGEDFDYYLRLWERYRGIKLGEPLFINRRGAHATGPRSATGRAWNEAVSRLVAKYRASHPGKI